MCRIGHLLRRVPVGVPACFRVGHSVRHSTGDAPRTRAYSSSRWHWPNSSIPGDVRVGRRVPSREAPMRRLDSLPWPGAAADRSL